MFKGEMLLMVQKSGDHQLRLVVYPSIFTVFYIQGIQDFFHQQYVLSQILSQMVQDFHEL